MENWHQHIFLTSLQRTQSYSVRQLASAILTALVLGAMASTSYAAEEIDISDPLEDDNDIRLIQDPERREVKISDIDTENFEFGISGGLLSVEDFETNSLLVGALKYHVTEDFFIEARFGQSQVGETSFEKLSGGASLLNDEDRDLAFYDLSLGINLFPGETFILNKWAVNSGFYLVGGVGATQFAGNDEFTINAGVGYRIIASDFLSLNFHVRDHVFETEITGTQKTTHNFEVSAGLSIFF